MYDWIENLKRSTYKKAIPILSFPSIQLLNITVKELISSSDMQAKGMKLIADKTDAAASLSMMDLSVEAEAFGSQIKVTDSEVPTVIGRIVTTEEEANALEVPKVGQGRTGLYIDAIKKACELITDRPVFAGSIGPFSLAGRLIDVTEVMVCCYTDPEMVHTTLKKVTQFLIEYIKGYKENTEANGVVIAEPLAGLLSPDLIKEFSSPYVKQIVDAVQDENFIVIYHNCGNNTPKLLDSIISIGASAYHFGNAVNMLEILEKVPSDVVVMGNIDPSGQFRNGTPQSIREQTLKVLTECGKYPNFIISSGCDIPPLASWENIEAFFAAVKEYYDTLEYYI